jgi:hypothetical protein
MLRSAVTGFLAISFLSQTGRLDAQALPQSGVEVLRVMHDAYAGTWYRSLTFVQLTTIYKPDGSSNSSTWYESLRQTDAHGTQLRIDQGDLAAGNGTLYTADSTWLVRGGKSTPARAGGNVFLPLIEGVYLQAPETTAQQLNGAGIDLAKTSRAEWGGHPAWIVGVTSVSDSLTPQFWIDAERKTLVRMVLSPAPTVPVLDIHLDGYVRLGTGWLATRVSMSSGGRPRQLEEYRDWKIPAMLPDDLFDTTKWIIPTHWALKP